jgi:hypothetical protein
MSLHSPRTRPTRTRTPRSIHRLYHRRSSSATYFTHLLLILRPRRHPQTTHLLPHLPRRMSRLLVRFPKDNMSDMSNGIYIERRHAGVRRGGSCGDGAGGAIDSCRPTCCCCRKRGGAAGDELEVFLGWRERSGAGECSGRYTKRRCGRWWTAAREGYEVLETIAGFRIERYYLFTSHTFAGSMG